MPIKRINLVEKKSINIWKFQSSKIQIHVLQGTAQYSNEKYQELCHKKTEKRLIYTEIVALITLGFLTIWEILQFISKVWKNEIG